jgi:hypothetical protein
MFHLWSGLTVLSGLLGRKVWMDKGFYRLYPNLFTVLVAGSARCRKTTAIEIAVGLTKNVDGVRQLNGKVSAEKFLHIHTIPDNQPQKPTLIKADELATFLTRDGQGEKLIDVLTKLFDCPESFSYDTITHGQKVIREPYVTVLAGTTPETLEKVLPDTAVGGGFASRIMFIYQADTEKPRKDFQSPDEAHVFLQTELTRLASHISLISGEASLDPEAHEYYDDWYERIEQPEDSRIDGFVARKHDHVLRVSMILCAARMTDRLVIDIKDVDSAIKAVETVERFLPNALSGVGSSHAIKTVQDKIMRYVSAHGRINQADVLKRCYGMVDSKQFRLIVDTLIQSGMLRLDGTCLMLVKSIPD